MKSRTGIEPRVGFAVLTTTPERFSRLPRKVQDCLRMVRSDDWTDGNRVLIELPVYRVREVLELAEQEIRP